MQYMDGRVPQGLYQQAHTCRPDLWANGNKQTVLGAGVTMLVSREIGQDHGVEVVAKRRILTVIRGKSKHTTAAIRKTVQPS